MRKKSIVLAAVICLIGVIHIASADNIQGIDMDFVNIEHAGNTADTQVMQTDGTTGYGAVGYNYRIGKYEVTNAQWNAFTAATGAPTGNPSEAYNQGAYYTGIQQPTNMISWYEAAQFCNYLTSGNKSLGAYQLGTDGSITINRVSAISTYGTVYVIPTEDEWYKAAYYKPDGSGYSLYANGQNTIPVADDGWNYYGGSYDAPWNVGTGTQEQNGTFDMMGNVWEWNETLINLSYRGVRGGTFYRGDSILESSWRDYIAPDDDGHYMGFRVASVPEPSTLLLLGFGASILKRKRDRRRN